MEIKEVGLPSKLDAAQSLIADLSKASVTSKAEHEAVGLKVAQVRDMEKDLESWYEGLEIIQESRRIQKLKGELARNLEAARKAAKRQMTDYEDRAEAERLRIEREAQEQARRDAEQAALEAAVEAEASGDKAQAEAILDEPISPAVVVVPKQELKAPGHTRRRIFKAKLVDAGIVPDEYWAIDQGKADAVARARKEEGLNVIPGFLVYSEVV